MPFQMNLWQVNGTKLSEIKQSKLDTEERLENWIAECPTCKEVLKNNLDILFGICTGKCPTYFFTSPKRWEVFYLDKYIAKKDTCELKSMTTGHMLCDDQISNVFRHVGMLM